MGLKTSNIRSDNIISLDLLMISNYQKHNTDNEHRGKSYIISESKNFFLWMDMSIKIVNFHLKILKIKTIIESFCCNKRSYGTYYILKSWARKHRFFSLLDTHQAVFQQETSVLA